MKPPLFLTLALGALAANTALATPHPNVVFVLVDDLGWKDLGYAGGKGFQTPNIDRLARRGAIFANAYAAAPLCSPSRASLMTGQSPARHGILNAFVPGQLERRAGEIGDIQPTCKSVIAPDGRNHLPLEQTTLGELFRDAGYATAYFGKWHIGGKGFSPSEQGFGHVFGGTETGGPGSYFSPYRTPGLPDGPPGEFLTERLTREVCSFIGAQGEKPFFAYVAQYGVHIPIQAPEELVRKYEALPESERPLNPTYAAMVEAVDQSVGEILKTLEKKGFLDNTIFILTSDNGGLPKTEGPKSFPVTSNAPARGGKKQLLEGGLRIPAVIDWPGHIAPGTEIAAPIISMDWLPTLAQFCGLKVPDGTPLDGISLAPALLEKKPLPERDLVWHFPIYMYGMAEDGGDALFEQEPASTIRSGRYKLTEWSDGRQSLYDIEGDGGETRDLAPALPELVKSLSAKLRATLGQQGAWPAIRNPNYVGGSLVPLPFGWVVPKSGPPPWTWTLSRGLAGWIPSEPTSASLADGGVKLVAENGKPSLYTRVVLPPGTHTLSVSGDLHNAVAPRVSWLPATGGDAWTDDKNGGTHGPETHTGSLSIGFSTTEPADRLRIDFPGAKGPIRIDSITVH